MYRTVISNAMVKKVSIMEESAVDVKDRHGKPTEGRVPLPEHPGLLLFIHLFPSSQMKGTWMPTGSQSSALSSNH